MSAPLGPKYDGSEYASITGKQPPFSSDESTEVRTFREALSRKMRYAGFSRNQSRTRSEWVFGGNIG
jgi:hypothetical protein